MASGSFTHHRDLPCIEGGREGGRERRKGGREGEGSKEWQVITGIQQLMSHTATYPGGVACERVVHAPHHNILVQPQQTARLGAQWNTIFWSSTPTGREQWS